MVAAAVGHQDGPAEGAVTAVVGGLAAQAVNKGLVAARFQFALNASNLSQLALSWRTTISGPPNVAPVSSPVVAGGMVYVNSGYGAFGSRTGNVLLAFGLP